MQICGAAHPHATAREFATVRAARSGTAHPHATTPSIARRRPSPDYIVSTYPGPSIELPTAAMFLYALARVFEYGCILQQQDDEAA